MIVFLNFFGEDFICDVDYRVLSYGCKAQTYGPAENCYPAEAPEWEIDRIALSRDVPLNAEQHRLFKIGHRFTPQFAAKGALFDCLANLDAINDAICQEICESGPDDRDDDRDF